LTVSNAFPEARRRVGGITSTNGQDVNQASQYIQSWSLTTEREIGKGSVLEVAFAGSKGTNLPRRFDLNQPDRRLEARQADGTFPRLFPQFQTINYIINGSNSIYNSGSVTVKRRFSKKLFVPTRNRLMRVQIPAERLRPGSPRRRIRAICMGSGDGLISTSATPWWAPSFGSRALRRI